VRLLLLLRHAKSSWADPTIPDHDRPLAPRGRRAARRIAAHLQAQAIRPELVLCSSARRARETLDALTRALGHGMDVQVSDDLYGADSTDLLERLRGVHEGIALVMVVAHNPGLHDLAIELVGDGDEAAVSQLHAKFPTAALATLDLGPTGWDQLRPGQAYLSSVVLPRELP
jgi:phosphohistidine phosphatase